MTTEFPVSSLSEPVLKLEPPTRELYRQLAVSCPALIQVDKLIAIGRPSVSDVDINVVFVGLDSDRNRVQHTVEDDLQKMLGNEAKLDLFAMTQQEAEAHGSAPFKLAVVSATAQRILPRLAEMDQFQRLGLAISQETDQDGQTWGLFHNDNMMAAFLMPRQVLIYDRQVPDKIDFPFLYKQDELPLVPIRKADVLTWVIQHVDKIVEEQQQLDITFASLEDFMTKFSAYQPKFSDYPPEVQAKYHQLRQGLNRLAKAKIRLAVGETFLNYLAEQDEGTTLPEPMVQGWMRAIRLAEAKGLSVDTEMVKFLLSEPDLATHVPSDLRQPKSEEATLLEQQKQGRKEFWLAQLLRSELTAEHIHHYSLEELKQFVDNTNGYTGAVIQRLKDKLQMV